MTTVDSMRSVQVSGRLLIIYTPSLAAGCFDSRHIHGVAYTQQAVVFFFPLHITWPRCFSHLHPERQQLARQLAFVGHGPVENQLRRARPPNDPQHIRHRERADLGSTAAAAGVAHGSASAGDQLFGAHRRVLND